MLTPLEQRPSEGTRRFIGRYELGAALASGGMASVHVARLAGPSGFEKLVAVKRIHPHLADDPRFVSMFLDEARLASRIQHPNVCQILDFGESEGESFIAMELLSGAPLVDLVRNARRSDMLGDRYPALCVRRIADACEGLHAAHELKDRGGRPLGVVHRDVSPQNLFVTRDGCVKVVDFGVAASRDQLHHTATGEIKGKFGYLAPEQAMGGTIDRRTDVFALGVVLWELLTHKRLFWRASPAETLHAVLHTVVPPPSAISRSSPRSLDGPVLRALARTPERRYATARDFGRDLLRAGAEAGGVADTLEIAEWLDRLLPDLALQHAQLTDPEHWPVSSVEVAIAARGGPSVSAPSASLPPAVAAADSGLSGHGAHQTASPSHSRRARAGGLLLAVAGLAVVGGGVGWHLVPSGRGPVDPSAHVAAVPAEASGPDSQEAPPAPVPINPGSHPPPHEVPARDPGVQATTVGAEPDEAGGLPALTLADASAIRRRTRRSSTSRSVRAQEEGPEASMEPRAVEPTATRGGSVRLVTPGGWATVYTSGGESLGRTPLTLRLAPGRHDLTMRPYDRDEGRPIVITVPETGSVQAVAPL